MDHYKVLCALTTNEKEEGQSFDESLEQLMLKVIPLLPEESRETVANFKTTQSKESSVRTQYVKTILYVLESLKNTDLSSTNTVLNIHQRKTVKVAVEIAVSIGILPCLLQGIGAGLAKLCPRAAQLEDEKLSELQKYDRLSSTVRSLTDCFVEAVLRSAFLPQLGPLLGALLQLSYARLTKPKDNHQENVVSSKFKMTHELYEKLTKDQEEFRERLRSVIANCPQALVMKELMIIRGVKDAPSWIRKRTREHLVNGITGPNGIMALVEALCANVFDLGAHWDKLDIVARLVATSHSQNPDEYYEAVCSQLVNLLMTTAMKYPPALAHSGFKNTVANTCITALYETNPSVCAQKVIRVIAAPLRVDSSVRETDSDVAGTEAEVEECIEKLKNCFTPTIANFKHPPPELMNEIAMPLFCLHAKARQTVLAIRQKIKQLLVHFLAESTIRSDIFRTFLEDGTSPENFGEKITCRLGPNGGLEVTRKTADFDREEAAESLFDLVSDHKSLSLSLFNYLLSFLSTVNENNNQPDKSQVLENTEDVLDRLEKQMTTIRLLSRLAGVRAVQEALVNDPEPLLSFVKSLFNQSSRKEHAKAESLDSGAESVEVLYVSLMLVKVILSEGGRPEDWSPFNQFATFLTNAKDIGNMPKQLYPLVQELLDVIKNRGRTTTRHYQDLSFDSRTHESDFDSAIRDMEDPLLPIRAHGLIALTKLIESGDSKTVAHRDMVLCFFKENLKHEDSFIYLAAIKGVCALALKYPEMVLDTLITEYIDMHQRSASGEISSETRVKFGEILMKTTRELGEMAWKYKNMLVHGFLCAAHDPDDMVRASSLSCLGELCQALGFHIGHAVVEIIYCIGCIIETDKSVECKRAAVMVATLLIRGLGEDVLTGLGSDLAPLYESLKYLRDNNDDDVLRLHAQLAVDELDRYVRMHLYTSADMSSRVFLLPSP